VELRRTGAAQLRQQRHVERRGPRGALSPPPDTGRPSRYKRRRRTRRAQGVRQAALRIERRAPDGLRAAFTGGRSSRTTDDRARGGSCRRRELDHRRHPSAPPASPSRRPDRFRWRGYPQHRLARLVPSSRSQIDAVAPHLRRIWRRGGPHHRNRAAPRVSLLSSSLSRSVPRRVNRPVGRSMCALPTRRRMCAGARAPPAVERARRRLLVGHHARVGEA
jgi:hypothetical protein